MGAAAKPANEAARLAALRQYRLLDTPAEQVYDDVPEPLVAEDVAAVVADAVLKPRHVDLDLIVVRPVAQASATRLARGPLQVRQDPGR